MEYLFMLLSAFGLGAAHALEPGHGKTVVAAYLVGSRGRVIDAVLLGLVVTLTHTFSVFVLAVASTVAAAYLVPELVQRWFSLFSGALVIAVGVWMIWARARRGPAVPAHHHHDHDHDHGHNHSHAGPVSRSSLIALGVSGGLVPCPAALLLIPAAIGLGAVLKGLLLVTSFSAGLAVVLMALGVITVKAAGFASPWLDRPKWTRRASLASACLITLLGLALTVKALLLPPGLH